MYETFATKTVQATNMEIRYSLVDFIDGSETPNNVYGTFEESKHIGGITVKCEQGLYWKHTQYSLPELASQIGSKEAYKSMQDECNCELYGFMASLRVEVIINDKVVFDTHEISSAFYPDTMDANETLDYIIATYAQPTQYYKEAKQAMFYSLVTELMTVGHNEETAKYVAKATVEHYHGKL